MYKVIFIVVSANNTFHCKLYETIKQIKIINNIVNTIGHLSSLLIIKLTLGIATQTLIQDKYTINNDSLSVLCFICIYYMKFIFNYLLIILIHL
jgi:chromate transport protein ChrA